MSKNVTILSEKVALLRIPPEAWDAIIPHYGPVSQPLIEYMVAGVIRDISGLVKDKAAKKELMNIGKEMVGFASKGLVQGWEDGDDICPPWRWPFPPKHWPWLDKGVIAEGTQDPIPAYPNPVDQIVLASLLSNLAAVTVNKEFNVAILRVAKEMVNSVAGKGSVLSKEFDEHCGSTGPRKPPKHKGGPNILRG